MSLSGEGLPFFLELMGPLNLTIKFEWFITMYPLGSQFVISVLDTRNIFIYFQAVKAKVTFLNHP